MTGPWAFWDAATIARISGCPVAAVQDHWPRIAGALDERGLYDRDVCLGVLGTVPIETASTFEPIHEYGTPADWAGYEGGPAYAGRGFIQLTHLSNYRAAGEALGIDLARFPELAMDPDIAAGVLAWFWATKGVPAKDASRWYSLADLCHAHDWEWVRRVVQGGTSGLDRLIAMASALDAYAIPKEPTVPTYRPDTPIDTQQHDWDCAEQSANWALTALGRHPSDAWLEQQMLADGIESTAVGLRDASGAQLAAWITREYADPSEGTPTLTARSASPVSFGDVRSVAGTTSVLIGGRGWGGAGHWTGVRRYDPATDTLVLANPGGTGPIYGLQTLNRQQFAERGPWSLVVVTADGAAPIPTPAPAPVPADPRDAQIAALQQRVSGLETALAHVSDILAGDRLAAVVDEARSIREQFLGKRPA